MDMAGGGVYGGGAELDRDYVKCRGRTPSEEGMRLFGVRLTHQYKDHLGLMRKSMSVGNLALTSSNPAARMCVPAHMPGSVQQQLHLAQRELRQSEYEPVVGACGEQQHGYVSDGPVMQCSSSMSLRERKKGVPWSEDEHRMFLAGLQKLGKGDWRGISRTFVTSRTPTQVASHAQKYFLRQGNLNKRKRRSSLFDIMSSNTAAITNTTINYPQDMMDKKGEFNILTSEHGLNHVRGPIGSFMDKFPPYSNPFPSPLTSSVSAELSLGRPDVQQWQVLSDNIPYYLAGPVKHNGTTKALLSGNLPSFQDASELDATLGCMKPAESSCLSSSSSKSLSSSLSPSTSFHRIDEVSELSRLSLRIGPPSSKDSCDQLALKLEQPAMEPITFVSSEQSATSSGNTSSVSSTPNAISVV